MNNLSITPDTSCTSCTSLSFDDWWQLDGDWVEEPNKRRGGESGVMRCHLEGKIYYVKKQIGHVCRNLRYPLGCPTILRESHRLGICRQLGITVPETIFCEVRPGKGKPRSVLVTRELSGFRSVDEWYTTEPDSPSKQQVLIQLYSRLGETLARLHNHRWQHGCLYDKHIFSSPARVTPLMWISRLLTWKNAAAS